MSRDFLVSIIDLGSICIMNTNKSAFRKITRTILSILILVSTEITLMQALSEDSNEIRLGATLPLSGDIAPYGNLIRDGIEFAATDLRKMGYSLSIDYEDVPTPGASALSAINKLIVDKQIHALVANFWNPIIPIMAPAITRANIIAFHTAAVDDPILDSGHTIFSTNSKIRDEAAKIANYVYEDLGARTACVLYIGTSFGENYKHHFTSKFENLGGKVVFSDLTKLGETDLRTVLTKIKFSSCEVLFAAYFGTNLGLVLKQAGAVGLTKQIMAVYEAEDPSVLAVAGLAAEGLRFFVPEPKRESKAIVDFRQRFSTRFGYNPRILASNAYDAVTILVKFLSECKGDVSCTSTKIYGLREYDGVSGKFSIDSDGAATKEFVLKVVRNGKFDNWD
jgi:branched-chain amino acid transport system substrate-binding protein